MNMLRTSLCLALVAVAGCAAEPYAEETASTDDAIVKGPSQVAPPQYVCSTTSPAASYPGTFTITTTKLANPRLDAAKQTITYDAQGSFTSTSPYQQDPAEAVTVKSVVANGQLKVQGRRLLSFDLVDTKGLHASTIPQSSGLDIVVLTNPNDAVDVDTVGCTTTRFIAPPLFSPSTAVPSQGAAIPVQSYVAGSTSHASAGSCTGCLKGFTSGDALAYSVNVTEAKLYSFDLLVKNAGPTEKRIVVTVNGDDSRVVVLPANQPDLAYRFPATAMRLEKGPNLVTLSFADGFTPGNVATVQQLSIH